MRTSLQKLLFIGVLGCALVGGLAPIDVDAATLGVPGAFPTIQAAVNAASAGDVIEVQTGVYAENLDLSSMGSAGGSAGDIEIRGIGGPVAIETVSGPAVVNSVPFVGSVTLRDLDLRAGSSPALGLVDVTGDVLVIGGNVEGVGADPLVDHTLLISNVEGFVTLSQLFIPDAVGDAVHVRATGTTRTALSVLDCTISAGGSNGIRLDIGGTALVHALLDGVLCSAVGDDVVEVDVSDAARLTARIYGLQAVGLAGTGADGFDIDVDGTASAAVHLKSNSLALLPGAGIVCRAEDTATLSLVSESDLIDSVGRQGILIDSADDAGTAASIDALVYDLSASNTGVSGVEVRGLGASVYRSSVQGNVLAGANTTNDALAGGVRVATTTDPAGDPSICLALRGNDISLTGSAFPVPVPDVVLAHAMGTLSLEGNGEGTAVAAIENHNTLAGEFVPSGTLTLVSDAACSAPILLAPFPALVPCGVVTTLEYDVFEPSGLAVTVDSTHGGTPLTPSLDVPAGTPPTLAQPALSQAFPGGTNDLDGVATSSASATAVNSSWTVGDEDLIPPTVVATVARPLLWPPRLGLMPVGLVSSATDNCGVPTRTLTVHSSEPEPPFSPDVMPMGSDVRLRAERIWPGPGRIYLVVVRATDGAGLTAVECRSVLVPAVPTAMSLMALRTRAMADEAYCRANDGAPPPAGGYGTLLTDAPLP